MKSEKCCLFTVAGILRTPGNCEGDSIKEQQQRSVQTKLHDFFKPAFFSPFGSTAKFRPWPPP
jgi:hypothetical protein